MQIDNLRDNYKISKITNLIHRTTAENLVSIIKMQIFKPNFVDPYHYDAGMNFLGVLGEYSNHQLSEKTAQLICEWSGKIYKNLPYEQGAYGFYRNILYDFNGSKKEFPNNDPRYILSVGSTNLRIVRIKFGCDKDLIEYWEVKNLFFLLKKVFPFLYKENNWLHNKLLLASQKSLDDFNQYLEKNEFYINVAGRGKIDE